MGVADLDFETLMEDRKSGRSMVDMREQYEVSENQLRHYLRSHERYHEWRDFWKEGGCRMGRKRRPFHKLPVHDMLSRLMEYHDEITIERGTGGGIIASIDDVPGRECKGIRLALVLAKTALDGRV